MTLTGVELALIFPISNYKEKFDADRMFELHTVEPVLSGHPWGMAK